MSTPYDRGYEEPDCCGNCQDIVILNLEAYGNGSRYLCQDGIDGDVSGMDVGKLGYLLMEHEVKPWGKCRLHRRQA